jgi:hypothetical protein
LSAIRKVGGPTGKSVDRFAERRKEVPAGKAHKTVAPKNQFREHAQIVPVIHARCLKYSTSVFRKYMFVFARPASPEGAFRDRHERWVRDAMDVAARETRAPVTDGEGVWS